MSRIEFMKELEGLLSDIPIDERNEALQYYNGYFEDAGEEHEEEILKELVSPARVAGIIKADLNLNNEDHENRGYFTEKGFQDTVYADEKYELMKSAKQGKEDSNTGSNYKQVGDGQGPSGNGNKAYDYQIGTNGTTDHQAGTNGSNQKQTNNTNLVLLVLVAILASPLILPFFGVMFGLVAAIFGIIFAFGAVGVAMIAVGITVFAIGIFQIQIPVALLALSGSGLLIFGLGVLFLLCSTILCKKILPAMIKGFVELCRLPFKKVV